jgi:hypothetical protein
MRSRRRLGSRDSCLATRASMTVREALTAWKFPATIRVLKDL